MPAMLEWHEMMGSEGSWRFLPRSFKSQLRCLSCASFERRRSSALQSTLFGCATSSFSLRVLVPDFNVSHCHRILFSPVVWLSPCAKLSDLRLDSGTFSLSTWWQTQMTLFSVMWSFTIIMWCSWLLGPFNLSGSANPSVMLLEVQCSLYDSSGSAIVMHVPSLLSYMVPWIRLTYCSYLDTMFGVP